MIKFRRAEPEDIPLIAEWISADPFHRHIEAGFFAENGKGVSCIAIEDEAGPAVFLRQEVEGDALRLHAQFPEGRKRVVDAINESYPLVANDAKERGFKKILFELESIALIKVMLRLGFKADLVADL